MAKKTVKPVSKQQPEPDGFSVGDKVDDMPSVPGTAFQSVDRNNPKAGAFAFVRHKEDSEPGKSPIDLKIEVLDTFLEQITKQNDQTPEGLALIEKIREAKSDLEDTRFSKTPRDTDVVVGSLQFAAGVVSFVPGAGTAISTVIGGVAVFIDTVSAHVYGGTLAQVAKTAATGFAHTGAGAVPVFGLARIPLDGALAFIPNDTSNRFDCKVMQEVGIMPALKQCKDMEDVVKAGGMPDKPAAATPAPPKSEEQHMMGGSG